MLRYKRQVRRNLVCLVARETSPRLLSDKLLLTTKQGQYQGKHLPSSNQSRFLPNHLHIRLES